MRNILKFKIFENNDLRELEDILNIARDEGIQIYYEYDGNFTTDVNPHIQNCDLIIISNNGVDISSEKFELIFKELDDRMVNTGTFKSGLKHFYPVGVNGGSYENIGVIEYSWRKEPITLNESKRDDINDILNIARDEGLYIEIYPKLTNFERPSEIRISRFYDNDLKGGEIMSSEKFLDICLDILNRLEDADFNNGKIDSGVAYKKSGRFGTNIIEDTKDFLKNWVEDSKGIYIHPDVDYIKRFVIN